MKKIDKVLVAILLVVISISAFISIYILTRPADRPESPVNVDAISAMGHTVTEFNWTFYSTLYNTLIFEVSFDRFMESLEECAGVDIFFIVYYDCEARIIWTQYGCYAKY